MFYDSRLDLFSVEIVFEFLTNRLFPADDQTATQTSFSKFGSTVKVDYHVFPLIALYNNPPNQLVNTL